MKRKYIAVFAMVILGSLLCSADVVDPGRLNIGFNHTLSGAYATIAGGKSNTASAFLSVVLGGTNNINGSEGGVIAGGSHNKLESAEHSVISGGEGNAILTSLAEYSVIGGGEDNTNMAPWAWLGGGFKNLITTNGELSVLSGGLSNRVDCKWGFLGGGASNYLRDDYGVICGGGGNVNVGYLSAIVGGYTNVIYTNSANVYWGNACFIGGGGYNTNIGAFGVIGGGAYNLVLNPSFYGVINGGERNVVLQGFGNAIGGGGLNKIAGIYSDGGSYNVIGGGYFNVNLCYDSGVIGGGYANKIDGDTLYSTIAGGAGNLITNSFYGTIGGGTDNLVTNENGTVPGGQSAFSFNYAQHAYASGKFANRGDAQTSIHVLRKSTSNTTTNELFLDGAAARMKVPVGATWTFEIQVVGRSSGGNSAGYLFNGVIENDGGNTTALIVNKTVLAENVGTWDSNVYADNGPDALIIHVAGDNTNVRWVATVRTTEVTN